MGGGAGVGGTLLLSSTFAVGACVGVIPGKGCGHTEQLRNGAAFTGHSVTHDSWNSWVPGCEAGTRLAAPGLPAQGAKVTGKKTNWTYNGVAGGELLDADHDLLGEGPGPEDLRDEPLAARLLRRQLPAAEQHLVGLKGRWKRM